MKSRILSVLLLIVLLFGAVVYGAYQGWTTERNDVLTIRTALDNQLAARMETASNILVVAKRHLPGDDQDMLNLESAKAALYDAASPQTQCAASKEMEASASAVLARLAALDTVKNDSRDQMYVQSMLPKMLEESAPASAGDAYNQAARAYNERLEKNLISGFFAQLLGITPCELFVSQ